MKSLISQPSGLQSRQASPVVDKAVVQARRKFAMALPCDPAATWNFCCYLSSKENRDFSFPRLALKLAVDFGRSKVRNRETRVSATLKTDAMRQ